MHAPLLRNGVHYLAGVGGSSHSPQLLKRCVIEAQQLVTLGLHCVAEAGPVNRHAGGIGCPRRPCFRPLDERRKIMANANLCLHCVSTSALCVINPCWLLIHSTPG